MIYDFNLLPFSLGDIITWNIQNSIRFASEKKESEKIFVITKLQEGHWLQPFAKPGEEKKYSKELLPVFCFNPKRFQIKKVNHLKKSHKEHEYFREYSNAVKTENRKTKETFLSKYCANHKFINDNYEKYPNLITLASNKIYYNELIKRLPSDYLPKNIICVNIRFRGAQAKWGESDVGRNSDPVKFYFLLESIIKNLPSCVKICLLGEKASYPDTFFFSNRIFSLRNFQLTLQHEIELLLCSRAFLGSSSGFAAVANFSNTPYCIFDVTEGGYKNYQIPANTNKLPFAKQNQYLFPVKTSSNEMINSACQILKIMPRKKVIYYPKKRKKTQSFLNAVYFHLAHKVNNFEKATPRELNLYLETFEKLFPDCVATLEYQILLRIANEPEFLINERFSILIKQILYFRDTKCEQKMQFTNDKNVAELEKKLFLLRKTSGSNLKVRAAYNLAVWLNKIRVDNISSNSFRALLKIWETYYKIFYGLMAKYKSNSINP